MSHTFELNSEVVRDAAIVLADNLTAANLVQRQVAENKFAEKIGKSVKVKRVPDLGAANNFDGTADTSETDVTEEYVTLTIEKHFYQKIPLTSDEKSFSLDDFMTQIANPCALSLAESIDSYMLGEMAKGFAPNLVGTAGNSPSTIAHILAGRKKIKDNRGTYKNVACIINTTSENAFLQLAQFTNADYGEDRPVGLREASLGRMHGASFFASQNVVAHTRGDIAGTVLVDGADQTGTSIVVDGFTAATGTVYRGTRLTFAGDSTVYTVAADATIASNSATLVLTSSKATAAADDAAVTFQAAMQSNLLYNVNAVYGAIIAPKPFENGASAVAAFDGLSVRSSFFSDHLRMKDYYLLDVYCACNVVHPSSGAVIEGSS